MRVKMETLLVEKHRLGVIPILGICLMMIMLSLSCSFAASNSEIQKSVINVLYNGKGGRVSCDYGVRGSNYNSKGGIHEGIDFKASNGKGAAVYAIAEGTVTYAGKSSTGLTQTCIYNKEQNVTVVYMHTDISIKTGKDTGQTIKRGQKIGTEGDNGNGGKVSPHTHVEIRNGKKYAGAKSIGDYNLENPNPYTVTLPKLGFPIKPEPQKKSLMDSSISAEVEYSSVLYSSGSNWPTVWVKDTARNVQLKEKTDYTLKYENNTGPGTTATITITGMGDYKDSITRSFYIVDYANFGNDFYAYIKNPARDKYLTNDSNNVSIRSKNNNDNQIWHFIQNDDGSYKIVSCSDGKVLDVYNESNEKGANVCVWESRNSKNQQWYIFGYRGQPCRLSPKCSRCVLDVKDGSNDEGTNIQMWEDNETNSQLFDLEYVAFTDTITLWASGFKNKEGNNNAKDLFNLGTSTFTKKKGESFVPTTGLNKVSIPNGFALNSSNWGSSGFTSDSSWKWYKFGDKVTQPLKNAWMQYNCDPVQYKITYNLNGGQNNGDNPSTYNVLYGVSFKNPTRPGYNFKGWTSSQGNPVTGINVGCNAKFSSASDMISKLKSRATGNQTITANWEAAAYKLNCYNNYSGKNYVLFSNLSSSLNEKQVASRDTSVTTLSVDTGETHNGYNSLKVVNQAPGATGKDMNWNTSLQDTVNNGYVGDEKEMVLSFWAKASEEGTQAYFRWGFEAGADARSVTLSKEWKKYTIPMNQVLTFDHSMHPWIDRAGTVWFSEIQLEDGAVATEFRTENGDLYATVEETYGGKYSLPQAPVREGYDFVGWYTSASGGEPITEATDVAAGHRNVYAHWTAKTIAVESVEINKKELQLDAEMTETLTATVRPENATDPTVIWTSSDEAVATVSADGTVTAVAGGTATITATAGGQSASCVVTVVNNPSILIGDVNQDGKVDRVDAAILNRYLAKWDGYEQKITNMDAADINKDGKVDRVDAAILNRYLAKWGGYEAYFM